ncbi:DNA polymerase V [Candidatus Magnetomorum sp. HK-1]|nr:DNA polymerase V [Candidatus Magnetomorum sp. HK-1]
MKTLVQSIYYPDYSTKCRRPLFMVPFSAGFPSSAEDYIETP